MLKLNHGGAKLIHHGLAKGTRQTTYDELGLIPVPVATETWRPVPYQDLVTIAKEILGNTLPGEYELTDEGFLLAQFDNQFFGTLTYQSARMELPFAVGLRGSYNRTLAEGICMGGRVIVCSNLAFSGLIRIMRRNTKNVVESLQDLMYEAAREATKEHRQLYRDTQTLAKARCTDRLAFQMIGLAWGQGILGERQLPVARDSWLWPEHEDFEPRTQWSLYNAFTHALKTTHPAEIMNRFTELHRLFME